MQKYSGAVAARPRAGFAWVISRGGPNLVLLRVVTALKRPPRYVIDLDGVQARGGVEVWSSGALELRRQRYRRAGVEAYGVEVGT